MTSPDQLPMTVAGARHRSRPINLAWQSGPCRNLAQQFAGCADPDELADEAEKLLVDHDWIEPLLRPLAAALARDAWFEPAFRTSRDALRTGAVLLDTPTVSIAATLIRAETLRGLAPPATVIMPGRLSVTRYVRGGEGQMRRWGTVPVAPDFAASTAPPCAELKPRALHDGLVVRHDGRTDGHILVGASSDIVTLTVTIKPGAAPLMREYAVTDGRLVRAACADDLASRTEMLLAFLRVSGRTDAAPAFAAASQHPAFHLRWAAMREWLMLDAAAARPRLVELSRDDPNAEVRTAATATLAALDRHLAGAQPCHA